MISLTLHPGETVTRDVQIGVHERIPFPGRHEPDEQRMTVCAVMLEDLGPGDYKIELSKVDNMRVEAGTGMRARWGR